MKTKKANILLWMLLIMTVWMIAQPVDARETDEAPRVTVNSVEWTGGWLKVPAAFGKYNTKNLKVEIYVDGQYLSGGRYYGLGADIVGDHLEFDILNADSSKFDKMNFGTAGNYSATVIFRDITADYKEISRSEFTIQIKKDSEPWEYIGETQFFDGSGDVIFHFKNGTNNFKLYHINEVVISDWDDSDGNSSFGTYIPVTMDADAGTITIKKENLKKILRDYGRGGKIKDSLFVGFETGVHFEGSYIYDLSYTRPSNWMPHRGSGYWWLDISNFDFGDVSNNKSEPVDMDFVDVNEDYWYYEAVKYVYGKGIMTGMNDTAFGPLEILSRAQFATILYRMEGEPETVYDSAAFVDVSDDTFFTNPAMWAKSTGIVMGYEDGRFAPADEITREQVAVMMYRYAEMLGLNTSARGDLGGFPDAGQVNTFAKKEMMWAIGTGLIRGDQGMINPQGKAERAQCATIIMRFMDDIYKDYF